MQLSIRALFSGLDANIRDLNSIGPSFEVLSIKVGPDLVVPQVTNSIRRAGRNTFEVIVLKALDEFSVVIALLVN